MPNGDGVQRVRGLDPPPPAFDPLEASPQELQQYGFPARPDAVDHPFVSAKWVSTWKQNRDATHLKPEFNVVSYGHLPNKPKTKQFGTQTLSHNWSGAILHSADEFVGIEGWWTVPRARPAKGAGDADACASVWVGIDGDPQAHGEVLQAGTDSRPDGSCYAWAQWYAPTEADDRTVIDNLKVEPGDLIYVEVHAVQATKATCAVATVWNWTSNIDVRITLDAPLNQHLIGRSAEAIVERPSSSGHDLALPRYGRVSFHQTSAKSTSGNLWDIRQGQGVRMVSADGTQTLSYPKFEGEPDSLTVWYSGP